MIIYISGPITGIKNNNREAFYEREREIEKLGSEYKAINPIKIAIELDYERRDEQYPLNWNDYMRACIRELRKANYITYLPGNENSFGSTLERKIAERLSIKEFKV
jgi:hypothetical protein